MKIYLRILQYAPHAGSQLIKFLIFSILAALFSASYLGLTKYMLDVLFLQDIDKVVPAPGDFSFSTGYLKAWLEYNFAEIV